MFKAALISTIFAAAAFQASADPSELHHPSGLPADVAARIVHLQQYGVRFEPAIAATLAEWSKPTFVEVETPYDLSALPVDVALRVGELRKHGERFEPAIRAIITEAAKQSWSFEDCGHDESHVTLTMN